MFWQKKKYLLMVIIIIFLFFSSFFFFNNILAADKFLPLSGDVPYKYSSETDLGIVPIIGQVAQGIIAIVGALVFAVVVYAGLQWLSAQGNEEKIAKAKRILIWAVLGLVVIFTAYAIISYTITGITKITISEQEQSGGEQE